MLLSAIVIIMLILGIYIYPRYIEPSLLMVTTAKLDGKELGGPLRIVFFGDTHFGELYDVRQLDRIVKKINAENPDIVIFTGDLIGATGNFTGDPHRISQGLDQIQATYGKYAVFGNHEYALRETYDYQELMKAGGFEVLVDDWLDIKETNVRILGLDDYYLGTPDKYLGDDARDGAYNIMMTHEPDFVDEMDVNGIQLVLAGHTHGGQISIPYLTERMLPIGGEKYIKGLFAIGDNDQTDLFVTKGIGMTQLPFRFMNVPEIVSIEIGI
ncbi:MAG: metallophosphoesterase [Acetobacterium sp.]